MATTNTVEKGEAGDIDAKTFDREQIRDSTYTDMAVLSDDPVAQATPILPNGIFDPDFGDIYGGPNDGIPPGTYDLWTKIFLPAYDGPGCLKGFLEVYKKCCGSEVTMYETSFEDNFDIYNNWIQIDADCGSVGGQYDSFTHTDARASDGDHSFKCSMYDIYKGNQDDYLECTQGFDISDQQGVRVEFDIWVEGSYEEYWGFGGGIGYVYCVFDYFDFEVYNHGLGAFINPDNYYGDMPANQATLTMPADTMIFSGSSEDGLYPGAYKFPDTTMDPFPAGGDHAQDYTPKVIDLGGGWWHVWYEISTLDYIAHGGVEDDFRFRFSWHSDPEVQYEGAYVDNVKVISLEDCEEKVFQTHTQGPVCFEGDPTAGIFIEEEAPDGSWYIVPDMGGTCAMLYIDFPLDWDAIDYGECGKKETCYDFKLWFELISGSYTNAYDWPDTIDWPVCVGEYYDCWVYDGMIETSFGGDTIVPGSGIMEEGEDMHITGWAHLQGTVPAYDVPITCKAFKKTWEEVYFTDFESGLMGWSTGAFGGPNLMHNTDEFAYSGSKALGCFDEDTMHYVNDMYYNYAVCEKPIDVRDYLELELDFYAQFITEGFNDYWLILMQDSPYLLGHGPGWAGLSDNGYYPTWFGPDQPQGRYHSFDMMYLYNYWYNVRGMFRNADSSQKYEIDAFGFCFSETDGDGYTNAQAEADGVYWSGLVFDDVKVSGLTIDEANPMFEDVSIIPEMEPCTNYEVQFEWEDVPYCNYLIRMDCECEGGCDNWDYKVPWEAQVLVVGDKERWHYKEIESIDLTGSGEGEWVISTSDYDNYFATQSSVTYPGYMNTILQLCPDHQGDCGCDIGEPCCLDVSHLDMHDIPVLGIISEGFDGPAYPATWNAPGGEFFQSSGNQAGGVAAGQAGITGASISVPGATTTTPVFDVSGLTGITLSFTHALDLNVGPTVAVNLHVDAFDGGVWVNDKWSSIAASTDQPPTAVSVGLTDTTTQLRFRINGVAGGELVWWVFDDVVIDAVDPAPDDLIMTFDAWWDIEGYPWDYCVLEIADGCPCDLATDWTAVKMWDYSSFTGDPGDGWVAESIDLEPFITQDEFALRFRMVTDVNFNFRGMKLDDIRITNLFYDDFPVPEFIDFVDPCDDFDDWCQDIYHVGQYWFQKSTRTLDPDDAGTYCNFFDENMDGIKDPAESTVPDMNDALIWTTEIMDCYEAFLALETKYQFADGCHGYVEIDDGSDTWWILDDFTGDTIPLLAVDPVYETEQYDISFLAGSAIQLRFRLVTDDDIPVPCDHWCVKDVHITGKQDHTAPTTSITMTGTMKESGWYSTSVKVKIVAEDNVAMGEIHYILDGVETVVAGYEAEFTINGNGIHTLEYWGVDALGNEEGHKTLQPFKIDSGTAPTVAITAPEPGIYLFGNKLLSSANVFIIGAFTIEANAEDTDSGIYKVSFYLDDQLLGEDTEAPFSQYVAIRHMGAGTIKVVAEDFAQNVAEDTLDIKYYKFF